MPDPLSGIERQATLQAGSGEYMAPELAAGGAISVESDLYAYGKIAAELLPDESWWRPFTSRRPDDRPASIKAALLALDGTAIPRGGSA